MTNSAFFHDGFRAGSNLSQPSPPDIPALANEYMAGFGAGLVAAWDAIPDKERRDLSKAFAKGFNEQCEHMSTTKPKRPRKSGIGYKFSAIGEKSDVFFERVHWVDGPGLGLVACSSKADAEMIAAALNLAARADSLKRKAHNLAADLEAICELFED